MDTNDPSRPLSSSLSLSPSLALSFSRSHTPLPHTHSMSLPNSLLPPPAPVVSRYYTCHTIPPSLILGLHHQWSLYSTYTLSLSHTNACTNTHRHAQTPIYLDPHLSPCPHVYLTHSLSNYVYVSPHYTTQSPMYMSLSILHTHRHKESVIIASVSNISHTHTVSLSLSLSLSLANTLNKGFPVNNLPSIHQQSWQYGKHETWKRINLHVLRPPSMTTRTRASQKARRRHPLLIGNGKTFVLHSREVIVLRPHLLRRWIECRC